MSSNIENQAHKIAFQKIDETCPIVEEAFQTSMDELQDHIETLRSKLGDDATDLLISKIETSLTKAEDTIKNEVTYKMRSALIDSCKETLIAEREKEDLESELEDQKDKVESLEATVESLETTISKLDDQNSKMESDISELNKDLSRLEAMEFNETLMVD